MRKMKFKKRRMLDRDTYLIVSGLRHRRAEPIVRTKRSKEEINALKKAKSSFKKAYPFHKMTTIAKTSLDG